MDGKRMRVNQAIRLGIREEMRSNSSVIVMGEDVGEAGGPFKTSEGLIEEFGMARVRDTPISEMGFVGAAVGAACMGLRPVVEIMFMEFLGVALDQLVTEAAKFHFMSNGALSVPLTVRCSIGSGLGFGLQHSQTLENWLLACPGLKVVTVSDAHSAYHLTRAAIRDVDPVVVLEPRSLYGVRGTVDVAAEWPEIGRARCLRRGEDLTVVAMGQTVGICLAASELVSCGVDLFDLTAISPWDTESILESVAKTGRLVTVEEAPRSGGWGAEIVATVSEMMFSRFRSAPMRVTAPDLPVPYNKKLESRRLPSVPELASGLEEYVKSGNPGVTDGGVR